MVGSLLLLLEAAASIGGMFYEVFYISYKMIPRHLPRRTGRVLNLLNVPFVQ
jgi:hypothetical protein